MHYHLHALAFLFENCCYFTETKHHSRYHSYEIASNLEGADKIYENTAINFQPLTSQARWKIATVEIIWEGLKEVKDLSYLVEN